MEEIQKEKGKSNKQSFISELNKSQKDACGTQRSRERELPSNHVNLNSSSQKMSLKMVTPTNKSPVEKDRYNLTQSNQHSDPFHLEKELTPTNKTDLESLRKRKNRTSKLSFIGMVQKQIGQVPQSEEDMAQTMKEIEDRMTQVESKNLKIKELSLDIDDKLTGIYQYIDRCF